MGEVKKGSEDIYIFLLLYEKWQRDLWNPLDLYFSEIDHSTSYSSGAIREHFLKCQPEQRHQHHKQISNLVSIEQLHFLQTINIFCFANTGETAKGKKMCVAVTFPQENSAAKWLWRKHCISLEAVLSSCSVQQFKVRKELMESIVECLLSSVWNQTSDLYLRWQV